MRTEPLSRGPRRRRRTPIVLSLLALVALGALGAASLRASEGDAWRPVAKDHAWSFPRDHHAHEDTSIEWWYVTGIVADVEDARRRFGFQFTLFRVGLVPGGDASPGGFAAGSAVMGHASITDVARDDHRFLELFWRASPLLGGFPPVEATEEQVLAWARAPAGTDGRWEIARTGEGFHVRAQDDAQAAAFDLALVPLRPRVFQGENGYSAKAADDAAASLYYSYPRLSTSGTLRLDGRTLEVEGVSWMDREFSSSQLGSEQVGWDWFALRLDDGRDLMLYVLRREDGSADHARGTLVEADGAVRWLTPSDWTVVPTGTWKSPSTGAAYPSGWRIRLPAAGVDVDVSPLVLDQENVSTLLEGLRYWEGAVEVRSGDRRVGEGYVELTGYGDGARLPL